MENQYGVKSGVELCAFAHGRRISSPRTGCTRAKGKRPRRKEKRGSSALLPDFAAPPPSSFFLLISDSATLAAGFFPILFSACVQKERERNKMTSFALSLLCKLHMLTHFDKANRRNQNAIKFLRCYSSSAN